MSLTFFFAILRTPGERRAAIVAPPVPLPLFAAADRIHPVAHGEGTPQNAAPAAADADAARSEEGR